MLFIVARDQPEVTRLIMTKNSGERLQSSFCERAPDNAPCLGWVSLDDRGPIRHRSVDRQQSYSVRLFEIISLKWTDVDRDTGAIRLRAEAAKTGRGRTVMLEGDLAELIDRRWQARLFEKDGNVLTSRRGPSPSVGGSRP